MAGEKVVRGCRRRGVEDKVNDVKREYDTHVSAIFYTNVDDSNWM